MKRRGPQESSPTRPCGCPDATRDGRTASLPSFRSSLLPSVAPWREFFRVVGWILAFLLASAATKAAPLNVVFILADDLGWSDLGCYGADLHETPNIDRLASQGTRFTQAYTMSVCSPTRSGLLTGRHPARLRMTTWREQSFGRDSEIARVPRTLLPPRTVFDLPHAEITTAEVLKTLEYRTLHVGKWHLGDANFNPETQGFDVNLGGTHWGAPTTYFHPFRGPTGSSREFRYVPGLGVGQPGEYLTDRLTDEALRLIDESGERPFFLNLWYHNPHTPIEGKPAVVERFARKLAAHPGTKHRNADYAAMIATLDENVGRVLDHLERRRLADRTLVFFTSDNGGYTNEFRGRRVTDNAPLRSGKGSLYEGGIRVPLIVRLPGVTRPGTECAEPVFCTDYLPTIAELSGARMTNAIDGRSLVPLLRDPGARLGRDALFFHFPHYYTTTTPAGAIRAGDWKLIEYFEDGRTELYRLTEDPGESRDLAGAEPQRVAALKSRLAAWRKEIDAQLPERTAGK